MPNRYPQGEYLLLFDPLDGSSNIDVNVSIGTIFSVLKKPEATARRDRRPTLQPGAAGRRRLLRLWPADHAGADGGRRRAMFTLDREQGSWVLTSREGAEDSGGHQASSPST